MQVTAKSDFWWVFLLSYGFTRLGRSPYDLFWSGSLLHLLYKRGVEPRVKPGVWRPKIWAQMWLRCAFHSCVNDSAELLSKFASLHSGVNDSAVQVTVVSMTPLCNKLFRFSRQILSYRYLEKGFNPCIRGQGGVVWWKKPEVENLMSGSL
jgi:hypothetical protein